MKKMQNIIKLNFPLCQQVRDNVRHVDQADHINCGFKAQYLSISQLSTPFLCELKMSKGGFIRRRLSKLFMNMLSLLIYIIFKKCQTSHDFQHNWNFKSQNQKKKCKQKRHDSEAMSILPQLVTKQRKGISANSPLYLAFYQLKSYGGKRYF